MMLDLDYWMQWGGEIFFSSHLSIAMAPALMLPSPPSEIGLAWWERRSSAMETLEMLLLELGGWGLAPTEGNYFYCGAPFAPWTFSHHY